MASRTTSSPLKNSVQAYRTNPPITRKERHWINLLVGDSSAPGGLLTFNPVVDAEYTTLLDASNNALKMSAKAYQYDYNANVTQTTEYDWFDPSQVQRDTEGVHTGVPASATLLCVVYNIYYNQATSSTDVNVYEYR